MLKSYLKIIFSMLIWGTLAIFVRNIPYASSFIVLLRIIFGLLFLLGAVLLTRSKFHWDALKKNAVRLLISGVFMGFNWAALFESYRYVNVSVATLCYYCAPVFVVIGSRLFFGEKLRPVKIVGISGAVAVLDNEGTANGCSHRHDYRDGRGHGRRQSHARHSVRTRLRRSVFLRHAPQQDLRRA